MISGERQRLLEERVLAPDRVFAQMPAVVTPKDDDSVFADTELIEPIQHAAHLGVGVANAGCVVLAYLNGIIGIGVRVHAITLILVEFSGLVPGGAAFGLLGMGHDGKFGVRIEI